MCVFVGAVASSRSERPGAGAGPRAAADFREPSIHRGAAGEQHRPPQSALQLYVPGADQVYLFFPGFNSVHAKAHTCASTLFFLTSSS